MSRLPTNQRALGLSNRTSLDLAVALRPIVPLPELVSRALLERISNVNEPFVPTVTSVKVFVTLLNVLVAPSLTICARRGWPAHITPATSKNGSLRRVEDLGRPEMVRFSAT